MKNKEIERKFIVEKENLPDLSKMDYRDIVQGYMDNIQGSHVFRLRQIVHCSKNGLPIGDEYYQTIKVAGSKIRDEYEIKLLKSQFSTLWGLYKHESVHKFRYELSIDSTISDHVTANRIYLDIYKNELEGLYTAEVEFDSIEDCDNYEPESWFGKEVTEDFRYTNVKLAVDGIPGSGSSEDEKTTTYDKNRN